MNKSFDSLEKAGKLTDKTCRRCKSPLTKKENEKGAGLCVECFYKEKGKKKR